MAKFNSKWVKCPDCGENMFMNNCGHVCPSAKDKQIADLKAQVDLGFKRESNLKSLVNVRTEQIADLKAQVAELEEYKDANEKMIDRASRIVPPIKVAQAGQEFLQPKATGGKSGSSEPAKVNCRKCGEEKENWNAHICKECWTQYVGGE